MQVLLLVLLVQVVVWQVVGVVTLIVILRHHRLAVTQWTLQVLDALFAHFLLLLMLVLMRKQLCA